MKKTTALRILAAALMLTLLCGALASCANKLSGTYTSSEDPNTVYTFSLFGDKMVYSFGGIEIESTYEIDVDKIYMAILGSRTEKTYSKEGSSIFIDGVEFTKE